ncbi:DUF2326 domain-containing protein [Clostridium botulinum]|nr:DUF2326 domain-containing protein [Clostridium botulinum]
MLIEKLIIRKTNPEIEIIREIKFNLQGLNLIIDKTSKKSSDSGNNVGKTTVMNIIDLCLGAKSTKVLYFDEDTKSENLEIKNFLIDCKVEAELILIKKLGDFEQKKFIVTRQLFNNGKRMINDKPLKREEFTEELKKIIFDSESKYPTLRQLIPKFIRVNEMKSENMIKYLTGTSNETYDTIYLFLLNREYKNLLSQKDLLCSNLKDCINKINLYSKDKNISSLDTLKQKREIVEDEISDLNLKRSNLDYMDIYKNELQDKRKLSSDIKLLEEQIQLIEFDINIINKNILDLNNEKSNINVNRIRTIYEEAKLYIGELGKTFDEVVKFHNTMIENRIDFIKEQLDNKQCKYAELIKQRDELLEKKKLITIDVLDEGLLDELNCLNTKIEELNVIKGELNKSLKLLEDAEEDRSNLEREIQSVSSKIKADEITEKNKLFNSFFSAYCDKLYGEKYLFTYNNEWRKRKGGFPVQLDSLKGKLGTGTKKSLIVAFDLAYIMYEEKIEIEGPRFVIHDKMENTHINQLKTIFKICREIKGQYIIPMLRERINEIDEEEIEKATILELSQTDKLFKI